MSSSTSSDLPKGKKFIKKLLYVQHVDKEKDTASEIPDRYLEEFLKADRTNFHDSKFTKYLKSPKANLSLLMKSMGDWITKVTVYSNPLSIPLKVPGVTIHAFVVFMTTRYRGIKIIKTWWSLEKNGHHIVLQQSPNEDDVIKKIYDTETKTSVERLEPIKNQKSNSMVNNSVENVLRIIWDTNMLNERYNLLYSNCQHFASFVFEKLSHGRETWSTVTTATFGRIGWKEKKIHPKIRLDAFKYKSILKDDKFDFYWAMMEGRREDFKQMTNNLTFECLNSVDSQGYTLLEWATVFKSSDWPIDEELKNKGAEMPSDEKGLNIFHRNVIFIALQYGPSNKKLIIWSFDEIDFNAVNPTGDTALHLALYGGRGRWKIAEKILNRFENYDVNITNFGGDTPLHLAAKLNCEIGLFTKILNRTNSENVNKTDENGNTALHYAIDEESETKVEELLARSDVNVDIKNKDHESALLLASTMRMNFPEDLFKLIVEKSKDINAQDKNGDTALHYAICRQSEIMTNALLAHSDVDVNIQNNRNEKALHFASYWKNISLDLFNLILEKSTDLNAQDKDGNTALHCAIWENSEIATKELLKHNDVNVNIKNNIKQTPLHLASKWQNIPADLFNLFLEKSTDINAQDHKGWTALHYAIINESEIATKALLARSDVDVNVRNNDNETVMLLSYVSMWKDIPSDLRLYMSIQHNIRM
jgi:ankyrin repeat protein